MIVLEVPAAAVTALAYSPDGLSLAVGDGTGRVTLFDPFAGRQRLACVPLRAGVAVRSLSFSSDNRLVAAGFHGDAVVWSASSGQMLHWHRLTAEVAYSPDPTLVAFHSSEDRLAIAHGTGPVAIVAPLTDRRDRSLSCRVPTHFSAPCTWHSLAYVGDSPAAGTRDHLVVWQDRHDVTAHLLRWTTGPFVAVAADPAGRRVAGARGRGVAVWRVPDDLSLARRWRSFRVGDQINAVALTPDGRTLLAAGDDWTVHAWDLESAQKRGEYNWRLGQVTSLVASPLGMTAAACGRKGPQVLIWDLE
jgi:WD40 repeat protein